MHDWFYLDKVWDFHIKREKEENKVEVILKAPPQMWGDNKIYAG